MKLRFAAYAASAVRPFAPFLVGLLPKPLAHRLTVWLFRFAQKVLVDDAEKRGNWGIAARAQRDLDEIREKMESEDSLT